MWLRGLSRPCLQIPKQRQNACGQYRAGTEAWVLGEAGEEDFSEEEGFEIGPVGERA